MLRVLRKSFLAAGISALPLFYAADMAAAAKPTPAQALTLAPMQAEVEIDQPTKDEVEKCELRAETGGASGWVLETAGGRVLRKFLDTNNDNSVDQWCYFKDGVEVYRDIDSNFNRKADQYRWLGTAGVRWAIDSNEDGIIDSWKMISAEETTAEVVAAFRAKDPARFERLLLTPVELKALGLSEGRTKELQATLAGAGGEFKELLKKQRVIGPKSEWVHFGGTQPGILPAGTEGSTKDVVLYDNVSAVIETEGKNAQLAIGTLIRVGENWRIIDVPGNLLEVAKDVPPKSFWLLGDKGGAPADVARSDGLTPAAQELLVELEKIDKKLLTASAAQQTQLHARRCDIIKQIIDKAKPGEDRANWIRQYADTVAAAVQTNVFPEGARRLEELAQDLRKGVDQDLAAYVVFRSLTAAYNQSLQGSNPDFPKIQVKWNDDLEQFVKDYPKCPDAAEAMLQLALGQESSNKDDGANEWYGRIISEFPTSAIAKKANGARRRLGSVGKSIDLKGKTIDGQPVDLAALRGRVVVVHYWATWCKPCKDDMAQLKQLQAKFASAKKPLAIIGVNLDSEVAEAAAYLKSDRPAWPQLYEAGGLEGRLATELGIWTLPTMLLIDKEGKVLNRDIHIGELALELEKQLK